MRTKFATPRASRSVAITIIPDAITARIGKILFQDRLHDGERTLFMTLAVGFVLWEVVAKNETDDDD